jgi:dihydrofolate synthase/folylpolyglutamate synthase
MVDAVLRGHGLSVGLYSSPHLETMNERLVWAGRPIGDDDLAGLLTDLSALEGLVDGTPSWFELVTAAAFTWFAQVAVDVAVVEVGLLGRFDATNVADGIVAVVTNVGRDHTDGGPGWRRTVAEEKAGIVKSGATLVLGETDPELRSAFEGAEQTWVRGHDFEVERNRAAVGGRVIDLRTPFGRLEEVYLPVHGAHQGENLALAVTAAEAFFDRAVDVDVVGEALADLELPGRFEILGRDPMVVLDGAHNPDGMAALATTLQDDFPPVPTTVVVLGMLGGRDPEAMVAALELGAHDLVLCTTPDSPRAMPAPDVAQVVQAMGIEVEVEPDVVEALGRARSIATEDDRIVVTGSLYVVGAARSALR